MDTQYSMPEQPPQIYFPAKKPELLYIAAIVIFSCLLCNSILYAGFYLGFAVFAGCTIVCTALYLLRQGHRLSFYSGSLLGLSLVIAASFLRGDDGFLKFAMFCFLLLSSNLGFCILAGQNRRRETGVSSLLDAFRCAFMLAFGHISSVFGGLCQTFRKGNVIGKKSSAVLIGLVIAIPLLAVVIPLLISADAAFDSLLQLLPELDLTQILGSILAGTGLACYFYCRGVTLHHATKKVPAGKLRKGLPVLTVNTVLIALCLVYLVYLFSQLAYFFGGFAGILPQGYTTAEYARRGFFEMAWLCAINLTLICLSAGLVRKEIAVPLTTRLLCLFMGIVTLFWVVSASAKMFLYIGSYGLTYLRVLTEVIMVFFGLTTVIVGIWLFVPKLPYMKVILLIGLLMGAAVAWTDITTQVARYNVAAYQSGKLDSVDMDYLRALGSGAIPYVAQLTDDPNPEVAQAARQILSRPRTEEDIRPRTEEDIRQWNLADALAKPYLPKG